MISLTNISKGGIKMNKIQELFKNVNIEDYDFDYDSFVETNRKYEGGKTPNTFHIPMQKGKVMGKSGLTNREGIDFGQQSKSTLKEWGVNDYLIQKVEHTLGVRGNDAKNLTTDLTEDESKEISKAYIKHSDKQLSDMFDTYKNADPIIKQELIQLRTHNYRLGSKVAGVLNKEWKSQKSLAKALGNAIKATKKGNPNRIARTIKRLEEIQ